jgi:hypothetical protein
LKGLESPEYDQIWAVTDWYFSIHTRPHAPVPYKISLSSPGLALQPLSYRHTLASFDDRGHISTWDAVGGSTSVTTGIVFTKRLAVALHCRREIKKFEFLVKLTPTSKTIAIASPNKRAILGTEKTKKPIYCVYQHDTYTHPHSVVVSFVVRASLGTDWILE